MRTMTPAAAWFALALALGVAGCDEGAEPIATASASGHAFSFSPSGGMVEEGTVAIVELPGREVALGAGGAWRFDDLPVGAALSFALDAPGHVPLQTATFAVPAEGLARVSFQAPPQTIYDLFASIAGAEPDPERCQLATTVTRRGHSLYDAEPGTHGEPGATVTTEPALPAESGPIYFNLVQHDVIYPDRELAETTDDGGVLFVNAPPGEYVLRAHKAGATFSELRLRCRAGVLVNASPPWGLQALTGGVGPRDR